MEAVVDLTARYLPGMVERQRGAIINLSSTAGLQPLPFNASYSAAKAYVDFLSEALHSELRGTGVTVTSVMPGPVRTGFQEASGADHFTARMPGLAFKPAERVAEDALRAAERANSKFERFTQTIRRIRPTAHQSTTNECFSFPLT